MLAVLQIIAFLRGMWCFSRWFKSSFSLFFSSLTLIDPAVGFCISSALVCQASYSCWLVFLIKYGNFQPLFLQIFFYPIFSLSPSSQSLHKCMSNYLILSHRFSVTFLYFLEFYINSFHINLFFKLASFTQNNHFEIHPCFCLYHCYIPFLFYDWVWFLYR